MHIALASPVVLTDRIVAVLGIVSERLTAPCALVVPFIVAVWSCDPPPPVVEYDEDPESMPSASESVVCNVPSSIDVNLSSKTS
jgi:hypothetical protein